MYSVGDNVVYPRHGAGRIVKIESREVLGRRREYLTIELLHNRLTALIPVENAERAGLRKVVAADAVDEVLQVLRDAPAAMPEKWHARSKRIQEKLGTGDIIEVAQVVRSLAVRQAGKGLPTGEKQLFSKAQRILASELMYARGLTADEAESLLEGVLDGARADGPAPVEEVREPEPVA